MRIASPSLQPPADRYGISWTPSYRDRLAWRVKKIVGRITEVTFGCRHRHITRPMNDHQTCLDCGATRLYLYDTKSLLCGLSDQPVFIGCWRKAVAETRPAGLGPMNGRTASTGVAE